jgi:uncharacterized protein YidB (DUF937 family)
MGLMDIAGSMLGGGGQSQGNGLMGVVMGLVNEHGGLQGLLGKLQESGLGEQAKSWVSTGQNLPVGANQIQSLLGSDKLRALAGQLGLGQQETAGGLAEMLPQVIDRLTPNGQIPEGGTDLMGMLKGFLG